MKFALALLAFLMLGSGCVNVPYGWHQEGELLSHWGANVGKAEWAGSNQGFWASVRTGARKEFHDYHPWDDGTRGWRKTFHRLRTP